MFEFESSRQARSGSLLQRLLFFVGIVLLAVSAFGGLILMDYSWSHIDETEMRRALNTMGIRVWTLVSLCCGLGLIFFAIEASEDEE